MVLKIFLFFNLIVFQQKEIFVVDEITGEPIESVHLTFFKKGKICNTNVTNEKGVFVTHFEFDSLQASFLGYKSKKIKNDFTSNIFIELSEEVLKIEEVVLTNSKKTKIIGEWKVKGKKEDRGFYTKEVYSILIENDDKENYKPISLLVNFKEVPKKAVVAFKFYSILNVHRKYFDQKNKEIFNLDIKIPDKDVLLGVLEFELPRNTTGIYEFNMSALDFDLPKEGFFVSPITMKIFDDDDVLVKNPSNELIPLIYSHKTALDNICEMRKFREENYWENNRQLSKADLDKTFVLFPTTNYFSPMIALKTEVLVE